MILSNNGEVLIYPVDWVFFILLAVWLGGMFASIFLRIKFPPLDTDDLNQKIAENARNTWLIVCWVWQSLYYLMIIGSTTCTLMVLYISCFMDLSDQAIIARVFIYSAFSIVFNVAPYMINMKKISDAYHKAHRMVNVCLINNGDVALAMDEAERIIKEAFD